jgi:hypothetical protein
MLAAIRRYLPPDPEPRVGRSREMKSYALLYEIMDVAGLVFEDAAAAHNGTPPDVSMLRKKPENFLRAADFAQPFDGRAAGQSCGTLGGWVK